MKKMLIVILAALLLFNLSVPALAEESEKVIRVGGNATVSLAADTATVQIGVETRNESVKEAQRENANLMGANSMYSATMNMNHLCWEKIPENSTIRCRILFR